MAGFTDSAKEVMLQALKDELTVLSLHSGDPGTDGSNELSGGDYTRESVTFGTITAGEMYVTNAPEFDIPANGVVNHVGFWAGTNFRGSTPVTEETYSVNGGTYTVLNTTRLQITD